MADPISLKNSDCCLKIGACWEKKADTNNCFWQWCTAYVGNQTSSKINKCHSHILWGMMVKPELNITIYSGIFISVSTCILEWVFSHLGDCGIEKSHLCNEDYDLYSIVEFSVRCAVEHAIVFTWLICMNGTSQYHNYPHLEGMCANCK